MKQLIEKSIAFYGMGNPETITDFNVEKPSDKKSKNYADLKAISGRKLSVFFDYTTEAPKEKVEKEKVSHKDAYLAKTATITKATTEEGDNVIVKTERAKRVPSSAKSLKPAKNGKLQLTIPRGLDNEGVKAFVLTQINTHLSA